MTGRVWIATAPAGVVSTGPALVREVPGVDVDATLAEWKQHGWTLEGPFVLASELSEPNAAGQRFCLSCGSMREQESRLPEHWIGDGCDQLPDDHPKLIEHGLAALASLPPLPADDPISRDWQPPSLAEYPRWLRRVLKAVGR